MTAASAAAPDIPARHRTRVPTIIQMEALECGAASLGMILGHFGRQVPLAALREGCNVNRDGATASRLVQVAAAYGLKGRGFKTDFSDLAALPTPFIAYWGFNHFVVVEGWSAKGVRINDPASGPRRVGWEEMDRNFTGVVLTFEPTEAFTKGGRRASTLARLPHLLRGHMWAYGFAALVGVFYAIPGIAAAAFLSFFVNSILANQQTGLLGWFFAAVAATLVVQVGLGWIQSITVVDATASFSTSLAARLAWQTIRLPMRYFTQRSTGEVAWRLNLPGGIAQELSGPLPTALISMVSVVLYFVVILLINSAVAMVALAVALLNFGVLQLLSRREREGRQRLLQDEGRLNGETVSGLAAIEFIKSTGSEDEAFNRFTGFHAMLVNSRQGLMTLTQLLSAVPSFLAIIASALAIGIGAFAVLGGSLSIGGLVALQPLLAGFLTPFGAFVRLGSSMNSVGADIGKVDDVLEQEPESSGLRLRTDIDPAGLTSKLSGRIEFRGVVFGYNRGAKPLLTGLSFIVQPGHRIAIVGTSGAGKSTVSRLLTGLEHPWEGEVLIDGTPRDDLDPAALSASLALVDQSIVLFPGSIMDNLTMWDASISRDRAVVAARDASIHEVIASRPGGYDAPIEEGGRNFSGGQAQRLEIARALTLDPTMLVLDEATSALDASTELEIDNAVRRRGCTTVVIAHRLSTIRDADLILVLDEGQVVQSGTHDELMEAGGLYRSLVHS